RPRAMQRATRRGFQYGQRPLLSIRSKRVSQQALRGCERRDDARASLEARHEFPEARNARVVRFIGIIDEPASKIRIVAAPKRLCKSRAPFPCEDSYAFAARVAPIGEGRGRVRQERYDCRPEPRLRIRAGCFERGV